MIVGHGIGLTDTRHNDSFQAVVDNKTNEWRGMFGPNNTYIGGTGFCPQRGARQDQGKVDPTPEPAKDAALEEIVYLDPDLEHIARGKPAYIVRQIYDAGGARPRRAAARFWRGRVQGERPPARAAGQRGPVHQWQW
jgi:hypothetical protein